jgi:drug/metabolite transporter (DMT)-like permease
MLELTHRPQRPGVDASLLALTVVWGINYAVIKVALRSFSPLAFNAIRFALATITIWAVIRVRGGALRLPRTGLVRLVLLGMLGNAGYQLIFIEGIARTSAANAALIMACSPLLVAVLGVALGRDHLPPTAWTGVAVAVAGVTLLLLANPSGTHAAGHLAGDVLILLAAATWALYSVLASEAMARASSLAGTLVTFLAGTPILLLVALPSLLRQDWKTIDAGGWLGVAFSGVLAIGIGYLIWNSSLAAVGGARTAVFSNLTPVVAAAFAWLALGERWTGWQMAGAALVLAGIAATRLSSARERSGAAGQPA